MCVISADVWWHAEHVPHSNVPGSHMSSWKLQQVTRARSSWGRCPLGGAGFKGTQSGSGPLSGGRDNSNAADMSPLWDSGERSRRRFELERGRIVRKWIMWSSQLSLRWGQCDIVNQVQPAKLKIRCKYGLVQQKGGFWGGFCRDGIQCGQMIAHPKGVGSRRWSHRRLAGRHDWKESG